MHQLVELYNSKQLHHAYFVVAHKVEDTVSKLKNFLEETVGMKTSGNPDVWHGKFQTLTVDDARNIIESESRKNISGNKKIFIIETDMMTEEAQNSLLKAFEEPTPNTHFFVVSPQDVLLPTLRSRMQVILDSHTDDQIDKVATILSMSLRERLELVKELTEGISDEEKTKQDAISLLNQVETELYKLGVEKSAKSLEVCELTRKSLYDRGAPVKMILENLLLSI